MNNHILAHIQSLRLRFISSPLNRTVYLPCKARIHFQLQQWRCLQLQQLQSPKLSEMHELRPIKDSATTSLGELLTLAPNAHILRSFATISKKKFSVNGAVKLNDPRYFFQPNPPTTTIDKLRDGTYVLFAGHRASASRPV